MRRGRPTLHALHGAPLAINAGDAMMFAAGRASVRPRGVWPALAATLDQSSGAAFDPDTVSVSYGGVSQGERNEAP